jgi:protein-tyrosine phosphatase
VGWWLTFRYGGRPASVGRVSTRDHRFSRVFNFRDLGGTETADGRTVRYRRLYRSDSLHALAEADREAFDTLGIRTVLDLRRPSEVERDGRVPEWDGFDWHHLYLEHRDWTHIPYERGTDLVRYLADRYRDMAAESASGLAEAVGVIADPKSAPVVVHCVAGKDRTGVVCALTLSLLGVSDEDIAAEYALSAANLRRFVDLLLSENPDHYNPNAFPLDTPAEAMRCFLAELRAEHGSIEGYLAAAGLPADALESLHAHLLE